MTFTQPIGRREGGHILGLHEMGFSPRDIRELMEADGYQFPVRSPDGIRHFLRRCGVVPHPSQRGPKPDGRETHCNNEERHPGESVERRGKNNDCPRCKIITDRERRQRVRAELVPKVDALLALGGEAAAIGEWIRDNVRVA